MSTTVPVAPAHGASESLSGDSSLLDLSSYIADTVDLGPHLGVVVRRRDAVVAFVATTIVRKAKSDSIVSASDAFVAGLNEHYALKNASWHAARNSACNERGLDNLRRVTAKYWYEVSERQQRAFDLLMAGVPVVQVKPLVQVTNSGLPGDQTAGLPMQRKVVPPLGVVGEASSDALLPSTPEASHGMGRHDVVGDEHEQPPLVTKPKSKATKTQGHRFPMPTNAQGNYEREVYVWMIRQCTRDLRAAQKRDEPEPTVNNMTLTRIEEVYEYGSRYIEGMASDPAPSHRKNTFRQWLTPGWIEKSARTAAEYARDNYDSMRLLLEEEAGRRGGEKSRRGNTVTIEMVKQDAVKDLSIAKAAKMLGCSPRTVASRRAEIRAQEAAEGAERADERTGEVLPAEGRTAAHEQPEVGPLRLIPGNLDLRFLAFKNEKYKHLVGDRQVMLWELR